MTSTRPKPRAACVGIEIDPHAHPDFDRALEVRDPLQLFRHDEIAVGVVLELLFLRRGGIGRGDERRRDRVAELHFCNRAAFVAEENKTLRQDGALRRMRPRALLGLDRVRAVVRPEGLHDPGGPARAVADDEVAPGRALQIFVALGRRERAPIFLCVRDLRFGQGGVEGIEPAIVRINAEPELRNRRALATGDGFEARLQPHRHEQDRRLIV